MNQQCKVCCEPAAGFHFGAFTCEGCKSFFGRTYNNLGAVTDCKNKGECVINKKNRTACKACRLKKCLMVGMSKSGSRYGRRSNWFKIHCLLEEQREKGSNFFNSPQGFYPGYPNPLLTPEKFLALHGYPRREGKSESGESSSGDAEEDIKSGHFMHAPSSSHTTPSPKHISPFSSSLGYPASPIGANPPYSPPVTTSAIFFPPQHSPTMLQFSPKLPTTPSWTPPRIPYSVEALSGSAPRTPMGGDALLCSPTVGGVAVEQDAPIDLSLKTSVAYRPPTPRSDASESGSDDELHIDVGVSEAVTIKNNPLDLTAKRLQVPS